MTGLSCERAVGSGQEQAAVVRLFASSSSSARMDLAVLIFLITFVVEALSWIGNDAISDFVSPLPCLLCRRAPG